MQSQEIYNPLPQPKWTFTDYFAAAQILLGTVCILMVLGVAGHAAIVVIGG